MKGVTFAYNKDIPRDLKRNLEWRSYVLGRVRHAKDDERNDVIETITHMCKMDPIFYMLTFSWTYDPRIHGAKDVPFIPYPFQEEAIRRMVEYLGEQDMLIEKSRDMGASWICLALFEWAWHFWPLQSFLMVSRNEDYVDKAGDMKALMPKVDFIHDRLPEWLTPRIDRRKLHMENLDNGSLINGESTTGDVARGDRRTAILLDEFASVERDFEAYKSTQHATNSRIFNSTPKGTHNAFYSAKCNDNIEKLRFHWSMHPDKAKGLYTDERGRLRSPWYDNECARASHPMEIAQELDIDYHTSEAQFFDDAMIEGLLPLTRDPLVRGDLDINPEVWTPKEWVPSEKGRILLWTPLMGGTLPSPPETRYVAGVDVATGTGATPSVISIARLDTGEKVCEVADGSMHPDRWAQFCVALCRWFHGALLSWEINGPGGIFTETILQIGYRNIYRRASKGKINETISDKVGWYSSTETKKVLLGVYRGALKEYRVRNYSRKALNECREYIFSPSAGVSHGKASSKQTEASSARDNHGDRVIADAVMTMLLMEYSKRGGAKGKPLTIRPPDGSLAHRRAEAERRARQAEAW